MGSVYTIWYQTTGTATVFSVKKLSYLRPPGGLMLQHGVEHDQQLSHASCEHDLLGLPSRAQAPSQGTVEYELIAASGACRPCNRKRAMSTAGILAGRTRYVAELIL
jgi:hypothetical protein